MSSLSSRTNTYQLLIRRQKMPKLLLKMLVYSRSVGRAIERLHFFQELNTQPPVMDETNTFQTPGPPIGPKTCPTSSCPSMETLYFPSPPHPMDSSTKNCRGRNEEKNAPKSQSQTASQSAKEDKDEIVGSGRNSAILSGHHGIHSFVL